MGGPGFVAARPMHPGLKRRFKGPTRSRPALVDAAHRAGTDASGKGDAAATVLFVRPLHYPVQRVEIFGEFDRNSRRRILPALGFAPIEGHAKMRAAGATAQTRMLALRVPHDLSVPHFRKMAPLVL